MAVKLLVCFIACFWESTASSGSVNQIAPGSDVSYSCGSAEVRWTGPRLDKTVRVKINGTEYLLIKNFQKQNKGDYTCGNENKNLELKSASTKDESVLFRASEEDSLLLFCKALQSSSLKATWFWRPHHSNTTDKNTNPVLDSTHFGNRLRIGNNGNDFSASISPVAWSDSGRYECEISSRSSSRPVFDVVVVRVHADPQRLDEGDDVTLKCEVSHQTQNIKLYWINMKTQENFPNPHQLRNVTVDQMNWACAVFSSSTLKALIPLNLTISQPSGESKSTKNPEDTRTTPGSQSPQGIDKPIILIGICIVLFIILIVLIGAAVCWRKRINERIESSTPERDVTYADVKFKHRSERMESSTPERDVTYADVKFKHRSEKMKSSTPEKDVTYADVKFKHRSETPNVASPVCELPPNSNEAPEEEKEVLYSSVKLL